MSYTYWLPNETGGKTEYSSESNSVMIIGANGAGKSKLGAWIERQSFEEVHRVGAQRNLNFNEHIQLKSLSEAENWLLYGTDKKEPKKNQRWQWGHYTTKLMDDFDHVLSALIALKNSEVDKFYKECLNKGKDKNLWPDAPKTSIEKLIEIWSEALPQRKLIEDDSQFFAILNKDGKDMRYESTEMSDGERAVLYLAAQVLCVPKDKVMIIDEPEVHLHRSIMNRLWKTLESYRPDCLFIYITHDLQFAAAHDSADKYWIKEFDGEHWKFVKIEGSDLPEELTLEILGSRKNVLFVEGERNSYDYQLYTELYPDYLIVPCGGCSQVIARTRAFRNESMLHECEVYGLVDRDYRSDAEISSLRNDHIYVLDVAEVENLFLVEELLRLMAVRLGEKENDIFEKAKAFVIDTKFANKINQQLCQSVVAEIKFQLSCIEISNKKEEEAKESLQSGLAGINYDQIKLEKEQILRSAIDQRDYRQALRVFNDKEVVSEIGGVFGIDKKEYQKKVINLLRGDLHKEIVAALKPYLPDEIAMGGNENEQ